MRLKDKAYSLIAHGGEPDFVETGQILVVQGYFPSGGMIEGADDMQESAFARAGRAHDGQRLTGGDFEGDGAEHGERGGAIG